MTLKSTDVDIMQQVDSAIVEYEDKIEILFGEISSAEARLAYNAASDAINRLTKALQRDISLLTAHGNLNRVITVEIDSLWNRLGIAIYKGRTDDFERSKRW